MRAIRALLFASLFALLAPGLATAPVAGAATQGARSHHGPPSPQERIRLAHQRAQVAAQSAAARALAARAGALREAARQQAAADARRATALSQQTVQAASRVQQTEAQADEAADRTADLARQRADAAASLAADARALAPLLPVIERLSLYPSETLLAAPFDTEDALTGLSVLRGLGRTLEQRAEQARQAQARLASLGVQLDAEQARLEALQRDQAAQQAALQARTEAAKAAQRASARQADAAARQAADAAARAATLDDAVSQIAKAERDAQLRFEQAAAAAEHARQPEAARQAREGAARLEIPAGPGLQGSSPGSSSGSAPVAGRLVQKFGDPTDAGAATGLRYAPPSLATVTAPCTGRIDFAGPFRSYGQMLIVNCGRDDRFVLAGLGGIDVQIGQSVARGGQLGHMPAWSGEQNRPGLYVQLRHGDRTIDPGRFLQGR